jgi:hypothetical protein
VNWQGGTITVYGNWYGAIWNQPGGQWNIQCDQYLSNSGTATFHNAGTVTKTTTSGTTSFGVYLDNSGLVQAQSGTIQLYAGSNLGGTFQAAAGAAIYFAGGSYVWNGTANFQGPGVVQSTGGNMAIYQHRHQCSLHGRDDQRIEQRGRHGQPDQLHGQWAGNHCQHSQLARWRDIQFNADSGEQRHFERHGHLQ